MGTAAMAGPCTWSGGCILMGELEARPDGRRWALPLAPQLGPGSPQHPLAHTRRPRQQGGRLSGPMWATGGACRMTWATVALARPSQMSRAGSPWPAAEGALPTWPTGAVPALP